MVISHTKEEDVLKIIVAGPVKSGKTHLLLIIEKTLREAGVKNLVVKDEE